MNYKTCKFKNKDLKLITGNCPKTEGKIETNFLVWLLPISIIIFILIIIGTNINVLFEKEKKEMTFII